MVIFNSYVKLPEGTTIWETAIKSNSKTRICNLQEIQEKIQEKLQKLQKYIQKYTQLTAGHCGSHLSEVGNGADCIGYHPSAAAGKSLVNHDLQTCRPV